MRNKENEPKKPRAVDLDRIRFFSPHVRAFFLVKPPPISSGFFEY